jgi:hypothetical protein
MAIHEVNHHTESKDPYYIESTGVQKDPSTPLRMTGLKDR